MHAAHVNAGFDRRRVFSEAKARQCMRHGPAFAALEAWLIARDAGRLRLLDVGCGDCQDMAALLEKAAYAPNSVPRQGEAPAAFQQRLLDSPGWSFLDASERETLLRHFAHGHPESLASLEACASPHGFTVTTLFRDEADEYATMCFARSNHA